MNTKTLDLDILEPEGAQVKLGGKTYPVSPPRLKTLVSISKIYTRLNESATNNEPAEMLSLMDEFITALYPIIPDLKNDTVDLSLAQISGLMEFVMSLSTPEDMSVTEQKKTGQTAPPDSLDTLPIS